jgi:hypothetical protein
MDLPLQCLKVLPDTINYALLIEVLPHNEVLIKWAFRVTIRQNLLALTIADDAGNPINYLLAQWRDTRVEYRLKNPTSDKQYWFLTGWEVGWGDPPIDCPGRQEHIKNIPSVHGPSAEFLSTYPQLDDGSGILPGFTLASVEVII